MATRPTGPSMAGPAAGHAGVFGSVHGAMSADANGNPITCTDKHGWDGNTNQPPPRH